MACDVMSFDVVVVSFDAMWVLVLCHVTGRNAMPCDVRTCHELQLLCPAMAWNVRNNSDAIGCEPPCVVHNGSVTLR